MPSSIFQQMPGHDPFYDRLVAVTRGAASSPGRTTVRACVFDGGFADPIAPEADTSSRIRTITVHIHKCGPDGWPYQEPPAIGDTMTLECGAEFAVSHVDTFDDADYILEARQK